MRRPLLLVALVGAALAWLRRGSGQDERDVWTEATAPRDLR